METVFKGAQFGASSFLSLTDQLQFPFLGCYPFLLGINPAVPT